MYTKKQLDARITLLVKDYDELKEWLSKGENVSKIDDTLFGMMISLVNAQVIHLSLMSNITNYLEQNPDAAKY